MVTYKLTNTIYRSVQNILTDYLNRDSRNR